MTEEERDALLLAFEAGRRVGLEEAAKLCGRTFGGRAFGAPYGPASPALLPCAGSGLVDIPDLVQAIRDLKD
jgi:hypothetical protein